MALPNAHAHFPQRKEVTLSNTANSDDSYAQVIVSAWHPVTRDAVDLRFTVSGSSYLPNQGRVNKQYGNGSFLVHAPNNGDEVEVVVETDISADIHISMIDLSVG